MGKRRAEEVLAAVLRASRIERGRRRISCERAQKIASRCGVKVRDVGRVCDRHDIKIAKCMLGCFR